MSSYSKHEQEVVQHFTHIHPLKKVDGYGDFTCDGCKTHGYGKTYHCASCNYKLHDHCATCPPNLCSFMHQFHELRLVCMGAEQTHQSERMCNICDASVEGLCYQCEECGFNFHPLCTQLPQHVKSVHHPDHLLELCILGPTDTCMVCHSTIGSWRYKCFLCDTDIHMECVTSFTSSSEDAGTQQTGIELQPQSDDVHQDKAQDPKTSKTKRMFRVLGAVTVGVVCNLIATPASESIAGWF